MKQPKVALVIDWLDTMGGAEEMLLVIHKMFPKAPIYTSVYDKNKMTRFANCDVRTTYMQRLLPSFIRYKHVLWPVVRAHAFRKLDMREFDLIISVSTAEAKAVKKRSDAIHICYCNTPTRYYWSHYEEFKKQFSFGLLTFFIRPLIPFFVGWMRKWDLEAAERVDYFIANSTAVSHRIKKYYKRESEVIFPPVDTEKFKLRPKKTTVRRGYIMWGRHVPYKRFDLAIEACNALGESLTIVGSGPETNRLKKMAGPTISFVGRVSDKRLVELAHSAKGFLFPGEEDFGIAPVEAMAAGLPVIAYKAGGALDYIAEGKTGYFFRKQTAVSLGGTIKRLINKSLDFNANKATALFSQEKFIKNFGNFVKNNLKL